MMNTDINDEILFCDIVFEGPGRLSQAGASVFASLTCPRPSPKGLSCPSLLCRSPHLKGEEPSWGNWYCLAGVSGSAPIHRPVYQGKNEKLPIIPINSIPPTSGTYLKAGDREDKMVVILAEECIRLK
jgi:hypothetical protein